MSAQKKLKFFSGEMTIFSGEKRSTAYTFSVQKDLIIVASVYFRKFCARAHARAGNGNKALNPSTLTSLLAFNCWHNLEVKI